jgi:hypothetical protein
MTYRSRAIVPSMLRAIERAEPTHGSQYAILFGVFEAASLLFWAMLLRTPVMIRVTMQVASKMEMTERTGDSTSA